MQYNNNVKFYYINTNEIPGELSPFAGKKLFH